MHERAAFEGEQVPAEEFRMEGRQAVLGVRQAEDKQRRLTWGGHELFQSFVEIFDELETTRMENLETQQESRDHYDSSSFRRLTLST